MQPGASPRELRVWDLVALASIGLDLLADSPAQARQALVDALGVAVGAAEDTAFAAGSGTDRPFGIAQAVTDARITQGITAASPVTVANLRALPWTVPAEFRRRAVWLMSTDAATAVAGLVDTGGGAIWPAPGNPIASQGGGLMGWDAYEIPGLPAMTGTNAPSIIFGDVEAGYRVLYRQRMTIQRLTERYAEVGLVGMLVRHRVAGDVIRPLAFTAYKL
jgi:HK97 family phage major capsid protein